MASRPGSENGSANGWLRPNGPRINCGLRRPQTRSIPYPQKRPPRSVSFMGLLGRGPPNDVSCGLATAFPPPYGAIIRINNRVGVTEAAFQENARRSVRCREGMRPNEPDVFMREGKTHERTCSFSRVAIPLTTRHDAVGDLNHAGGVGRAFEPGATDYATVSALHYEKPVAPRIWVGGRMQCGEPLRRHVSRYEKAPQAVIDWQSHNFFKALRLLDERKKVFRSAREQGETQSLERHAWLEPRPNGSRLSCVARKKDSFPNLRAPPASSAC